VDGNIFRQAECLIRFLFHVDPDTLTDEEFKARFQEALWLERRQKIMMQNAIADAFNGESK